MDNKASTSKLVELYGVHKARTLDDALAALRSEPVVFQILFAGWLQGVCLKTNDSKVLASYLARMNLGVQVPSAEDLRMFANELNEALLPRWNKKRPV